MEKKETFLLLTTLGEVNSFFCQALVGRSAKDTSIQYTMNLFTGRFWQSVFMWAETKQSGRHPPLLGDCTILATLAMERTPEPVSRWDWISINVFFATNKAQC